MATTETPLRTSKRQLVLRDSAAFLLLLVITGLLFAITLFLFRSFSAHRATIARQAGEEGQVALDQGRPHDAIADLRTALSYAPNERRYELLLAQALAGDGHLEEAINYFLNLWESQPGDGFINLQLARLERQRDEQQAAIDYYRAAIFGSWNGEAVTRRRDVRLELANYLIDQKQFTLAQTELLIASSNAPSIPGFNLSLGDTFLRANDQRDAMTMYEKAIADDLHQAVAYEKAGRLAYKMGDYVKARDWLERALRENAGAVNHTGHSEDDTATLLKNSERLLQLEPDLAGTRADRVARLLADRTIAKKRFDVCTKQANSLGPPPVSMQTLAVRWATSSTNTSRNALMRDDSNQDLVRSLIKDTETTTAQMCGSPLGDDALLLLLAQQQKNQ